MTLYVDDITVSGVLANDSLLEQIKNRIEATGLKAHKLKTYVGTAAKVTGAIVLQNKVALPHDRAKDIRELQKQLDYLSGAELSSALSRLVGKLNEAQQFVSEYGLTKKALLARYATTWKEITDDRAKRSRRAMLKRRRTSASRKTSPRTAR